VSVRALPLLLLVLLGCAEERPALEVTLTALPRTVRSLSAQVALHGQPPWPAQAFSGGSAGFIARLPRGARGPATLQVGGLDQHGCEVARGSAQVQLAGDFVHEVALALTRLPDEARGCRIVVEKGGDGAVTSRPAGIACARGDTRCEAVFAYGTPVELIAERAADSAFSGWSGACGGIGPCRIVVEGGVLSVRAAFQARTLCRGGWCWENPRPQGNRLRAVWARSPDEAWAVGDGGMILRWNGAFWYGVESGTMVSLRGVWGDWAVGDAGTILRRDGSAWKKVESGTAVPLRGMWGDWVVGDAGTILRRDGAAWRRVESGTAAALLAVWERAAGEPWAAGEAGTLLRWDGRAWARVATGTTRRLTAGWGPFAVGEAGTVLRWSGGAVAAVRGPAADLLAVWGAGEKDVWIAGAGGGTYHLAGQGAEERFVPVQTSSGSDLLALSGSGPGELWAVGSGGTLLRWNGAFFTALHRGIQDGVVATYSDFGGFGAISRRGGVLLIPGDGRLFHGPSSVEVPLHDVYFDGAARPPFLLAVGERGGVCLNVEGDTTCRLLPSPTTRTLRALWGGPGPGAELWAVGDGGVILRGRGGAFAVVNPRVTDRDLYAVFGFAPDEVWAAGEGGVILRWDGAAWQALGSPVATRLRGLWGPRSGELWAVGDQGTVLLGDGRTSRVIQSGTTANLRAVHGTSRGRADVWVAGEAGVVLHHDGTGFRQVAAGTGNDLNDVLATGSEVYLVGEEGTILRHRPPPAR
jgi:PAS domain-containing protein